MFKSVWNYCHFVADVAPICSDYDIVKNNLAMLPVFSGHKKCASSSAPLRVLLLHSKVLPINTNRPCKSTIQRCCRGWPLFVTMVTCMLTLPDYFLLCIIIICVRGMLSPLYRTYSMGQTRACVLNFSIPYREAAHNEQRETRKLWGLNQLKPMVEKLNTNEACICTRST